MSKREYVIDADVAGAGSHDVVYQGGEEVLPGTGFAGVPESGVLRYRGLEAKFVLKSVAVDVVDGPRDGVGIERGFCGNDSLWQLRDPSVPIPVERFGGEDGAALTKPVTLPGGMYVMVRVRLATADRRRVRIRLVGEDA